MKIPLVDLKAQYASIKEEIDAAIFRVIQNTSFIGGQEVADFEQAFAAACEAPYCVGTGNGTDALYLAMKGLGIGPGQEVLVPANSFIATSEAVTQTGAKVVFVDVDPDTCNISIDDMQKKCTGDCKAIIPVHLFGHPADMEPIMQFAADKGLKVIEDAAQAHLARYQGQTIGTFGDAACFSFYPGKNLGAYGDAGAVVTKDESLATEIRRLANHGRLSKFGHQVEGYNSRLDSLQAAILAAKLRHLPAWTESRRKAAAKYGEYLDASLMTLPKEAPNCKAVYHLYVIRSPKRDELRQALLEKGIGCGIHYPTPLPQLEAYDHLGHAKGDFPVAEELSASILSLPMYPELTEEQIAAIAGEVNRFLAG